MLESRTFPTMTPPGGLSVDDALARDMPAARAANRTLLWLLGGYMWLFIHRPFEIWPWMMDLHVERVYMLFTLLYWGLVAEKHWIGNRLNRGFVCFWLVMLVSWTASPYSTIPETTMEDYCKVAVFYILILSTVRTEQDLKLLLAMYLGAMTLYMAHSLWEYHNGRHVYTMGTARLMAVDVKAGDPNSFAGTIVYSLPVAAALWTSAANGRWRWAVASYLGLAVACVSLTGSRMGLVGVGALALMAVLVSKRRLLLLLLLAVAVPLIWNCLPTDRQNRYLTLIDPSYGPANAEESAKGRGEGWRDGVRLWRENPLYGVGPGSFAPARGYPLQPHHLYGQLLGELGTLGAVAFAMIVWSFFANYLEMRRMTRHAPQLAFSFPARVIRSVTATVILLLVMGLASHNLYRYAWLWFGAFQAVALHVLNERRMAAEEGAGA
jgi:O-antigen ligase